MRQLVVYAALGVAAWISTRWLLGARTLDAYLPRWLDPIAVHLAATFDDAAAARAADETTMKNALAAAGLLYGIGVVAALSPASPWRPVVVAAAVVASSLEVGEFLVAYGTLLSAHDRAVLPVDDD